MGSAGWRRPITAGHSAICFGEPRVPSTGVWDGGGSANGVAARCWKGNGRLHGPVGNRRGHLVAPDDLAAVVTEKRLAHLPLAFDHAERAAALPPHHRRPLRQNADRAGAGRRADPRHARLANPPLRRFHDVGLRCGPLPGGTAPRGNGRVDPLRQARPGSHAGTSPRNQSRPAMSAASSPKVSREVFRYLPRHRHLLIDVPTLGAARLPSPHRPGRRARRSGRASLGHPGRGDRGVVQRRRPARRMARDSGTARVFGDRRRLGAER